MKAALLGLTHPHAGILLTTLDNQAEVTSIVLWDPEPGAAAAPSLPASRKVSGVQSDLDRVLTDPELVFVVVCLRHDQMAAVARRVAAARKHLIAEKPAGLNAREIADLKTACAAAGVVASVLYPRRFHPCVSAARTLVQSGGIGDLLTFEMRFLTTQVKFRDPKSWLFRRAWSGGGILLWLGSHCLDLLHHITDDEVIEVGAFLANRSGEAIEVEDAAALILKFRHGAIGTFHAGYTLAFSGAGYLNATGYDSYVGLNGRAGRIVWPDLQPRMQVERARPPGQPALQEETYPQPASTSYGGAAGDVFFHQFIAAIQLRGQPPTTLGDALRVARIVEAAEQSSATGQFVRVEAPVGSHDDGHFMVKPVATTRP